MSEKSDQFSGRIGLIFAAIGAAIGTGNIWRFPRMVGANAGGLFHTWLFSCSFGPFHWSLLSSPWEKEAELEPLVPSVSLRVEDFAWMGLWTAWISTAIGFYYAIVAGWCLNYFRLGMTNGLVNVDTVDV